MEEELGGYHPEWQEGLEIYGENDREEGELGDGDEVDQGLVGGEEYGGEWRGQDWREEAGIEEEEPIQ